MSLSPAEQKVRKLAKLPGNCVCANCGTKKKFGFSTVCIKFFTFVCNNCKSSHQAISHRCKSLTMSSWADPEVAELERKGNDYARRTWLQKAPAVGSGGRPREGDHVDVFKRFVVEVYERKRYYGEDTGAAKPPPVTQHVATAVPLTHPPASIRTPVKRVVAAPPVRNHVPHPSPATAPVADLLDFSAPAAPTGGSDMFQANFDAFASSPAPALSVPAATPSVTTSSNSQSNAFQADFVSFSSAPTPTPAPATPSPSAFSFIKAPPAAAPVSTPAGASSFAADFSGMSVSAASPTPAATPVTTQAKKPVMSNHSSNEKSSLISSMSTHQPGNNPQGIAPMQQFGGFQQQPNPNMMMSSPQMQQQMKMMQHQQWVQAQGINNGMGMGMPMNNGMVNGGMNMGMPMGGMNNMMNPQQMMMNAGFGGNSMGMGGSSSGNGNNNPNSMNSLNMNTMSMNAWTSGSKKNTS